MLTVRYADVDRSHVLPEDLKLELRLSTGSPAETTSYPQVVAARLEGEIENRHLLYDLEFHVTVSKSMSPRCHW
jgi:hypothetical protein